MMMIFGERSEATGDRIGGGMRKHGTGEDRLGKARTNEDKTVRYDKPSRHNHPAEIQQERAH